MRLAWAITVHKSQGLTFSHVIIDFTGGAFAGGQTYVALSRCTSLDGIVLKKQISRSDIFIKPEIISFSRQFNDKKLIEQSLKLAQADRLYQEAVKYFDKGDFDNFLNVFFDDPRRSGVRQRTGSLCPIAKLLFSKKLLEREFSPH